MTQDKIREAFEAWGSKYGWDLQKSVLGEFANIETSSCFKGYQACAAEMGKDMAKVRPYLWHKQQCEFVTSFAKDCDCGYAEAIVLPDKWRG